jgi:hypothetical protein
MALFCREEELLALQLRDEQCLLRSGGNMSERATEHLAWAAVALGNISGVPLRAALNGIGCPAAVQSVQTAVAHKSASEGGGLIAQMAYRLDRLEIGASDALPVVPLLESEKGERTGAGEWVVFCGGEEEVRCIISGGFGGWAKRYALSSTATSATDETLLDDTAQTFGSTLRVYRRLQPQLLSHPTMVVAWLAHSPASRIGAVNAKATSARELALLASSMPSELDWGQVDDAAGGSSYVLNAAKAIACSQDGTAARHAPVCGLSVPSPLPSTVRQEPLVFSELT